MKIIFQVAALLLTLVLIETTPVKLYKHRKNTTDYFVEIENPGEVLLQQLMVKSTTKPTISSTRSNLNLNSSETTPINSVSTSSQPHSAFSGAKLVIDDDVLDSKETEPPSSLCKPGKGSCAECLTERHDCSNFNAECVTHVTTFTSVYLCKCQSNDFVFSPICLVSIPGFKFHCPCTEGKVYNAAIGSCVGQTIVIRCRDEGRFRFKPKWTRPVSENKLSDWASQREDRLHINSSQPFDNGVYICFVGNEYSKDEPNQIALVKVKPDYCVDVSVVIYDEKQVEFVQGNDVRLSCKDEGPNNYPVEWYREDGGALPANWSILEGVLGIKHVHPRDNGLYVCEANSIDSTMSRPPSCSKDYFYINVRPLGL